MAPPWALVDAPEVDERFYSLIMAYMKWILRKGLFRPGASILSRNAGPRE
jgi:hypothetical protein